MLDILAAVLGAGLLVLFICTAKYGVAVPDEGFYYSVTHRVLLGEKWIADEWNLAQLVLLFNLLPNYLFMKITGGTEGIILFMRFLFIFLLAIYYVFVYVKLRRFKGWGVAAAFLFCAVVQQTLFALCYFTVAPMAAFAVWLILADERKPHRVPTLLAAGFIMACGILAEPFLIGVFFIWFVLTLVRQVCKKQTERLLSGCDFVLNRRTFFWMSVGAAALFFPYMGYLIISGSFGNISAELPYILSGKEYNSGNLIDLRKIKNAIGYFGAPALTGSALTLLAAVGLRISRQKNRI